MQNTWFLLALVLLTCSYFCANLAIFSTLSISYGGIFYLGRIRKIAYWIRYFNLIQHQLATYRYDKMIWVLSIFLAMCGIWHYDRRKNQFIYTISRWETNVLSISKTSRKSFQYPIKDTFIEVIAMFFRIHKMKENISICIWYFLAIFYS